jgi:endoglucanase
MKQCDKYIKSLFLLGFICSLFVSNLVSAISGPLSTSGNQIIAADGSMVRLQGVSWFGFESSNLVPHGLWTRSYQSMMDQMQSLGFNTIRIPFCNQMFDANSKPNSINERANPDLIGLNSLQILDKIVEYADQIGIWIILDHHRSDAGMGALNNGLWHTDAYPESRFIQDWQMLAERYRHHPSVIGADLHNEPHASASWGTRDQNTDWRAAAERAGNAILKVNPHWLIIVEGVESYQNKNYWWGGNLAGVKDHPIVLDVDNKLVYSPHDYPNSIYNQPWFTDSNYPHNLLDHFRNVWGYIFETEHAPIIIGEFGSRFLDPKDAKWMDKITTYLNGDFKGTGHRELPAAAQGASWIWWSWNPNSGDTGGILLDDWMTPDQTKLQFIKPLMTNGSSNSL